MTLILLLSSLFIDYLSLDDGQFICSGSIDNTIRVWDIENNKQIQSFNGNSNVYCVKFSRYHYYNNHRSVICSSLHNETIHFWDFKDNQQLKTLNKHTGWISDIYVLDLKIKQFVYGILKQINYYIFNGHTKSIWCVDISPLQSNNNKNEINNIGVIGGNGYTICSGSFDNTICIWAIETTKQLIIYKDIIIGLKV
ncbi:hypothetical protein RFI_29509 [Reticulomyxa filosa]|uniref:WD-40 repeat protein n=1 Tax=Reticulomyxa filosa TaxID=46433 RepID=X6M349_RETFI|nr:hypothetical protein RFI_29509 [Reticulomyxa filosa]|eukprot:ETO07882.1 hypothetical protein RFI_29509 [Reticulomyxa filosa]